MAVAYDKYYETVNLFGEPFPELLHFLANWKTKGTLLDLGCGQGRDAIPLARLGFEVTGVDNSKVGIEQMNLVALNEKLPLKGIVDDIYKLEKFKEFDVILMNSMFHFTKKDKNKETNFIKKLIDQTKIGALIIFCIHNSGDKVKILNQTVNETGKLEVELENEFEYVYEDSESGRKSKTNYKMLAFRKRDHFE